ALPGFNGSTGFFRLEPSLVFPFFEVVLGRFGDLEPSRREPGRQLPSVLGSLEPPHQWAPRSGPADPTPEIRRNEFPADHDGRRSPVTISWICPLVSSDKRLRSSSGSACNRSSMALAMIS